ncbi:ATP-binding protein, partial [Streptomyces sp. A3M-1-3]|uniref:ATP-binding protein n=1 Tax=Streptomyces sp. A3M-1-3 TaxID=2962044 RepID=UPI0020B884F2
TAGSGRGPLEKGPRSGNLASGLPVLAHGRVPGRDFELRIVVGDELLRIEVSDTRGDRQPAPRQPVPALGLAESGHGLLLVETLATAWGVHARTVGKTVWAELELNPAGSR